MISKWNVLFLIAVFISAGFTWPGQKKAASDGPQKSQSQTVTVKAEPRQSDAQSDEPAGEEAAIPQLPQIPQIPKPVVPQGGFAKNPSIPSLPDDIVKIQKEIREITEMNDQLKAKYKEQASEIQKISDQAKIHQRILQELQEQNAQTQALGKNDARHLLEQEKIRAIQKETEEKKRYLQNLEKRVTIPSSSQVTLPGQNQQNNGAQTS